MKKSVIAIIAIALVAVVMFLLPGLTAQEGAKDITITITNEVTGEELLNEAFKTDALNLGDFLAENTEALQVEMEDSEYGRFLNGLMGLTPTSMDEGPWWMYGYTSPSKDISLPVGGAPAVDEVMLQDGDTVDFVFTTNMGF